METSEGRGIARSRWLRWWSELPDDFREAMGEETGYLRVNREPYEAPPDFWAGHAQEIRERSELIGFWIAWHQAGGFQALELSGWNRATIYRKLKRFRSVFDAHPDEYDFNWITLDLPQTWFEELGVELGPAPKKRGKK